MGDPQPNLTSDEDSRSTRIMTRLQDSILSQLGELNPSFTIQTHHSSFIQCRLQQLFGSFNTPTHPPYALMIHKAIMELNEGSGLTVEAISDFTLKKYKDLPWAHSKILRLHLGRLCQEGELVCAEGGKYMLVVDDDGVGRTVKETVQFKGIKRRKRSERRSNREKGETKGTLKCCEGGDIEIDNGLLEEGINEHVQVSELDRANNEETRRVVKRRLGQGLQPDNQSIERVEESERRPFEVVGKQSRGAPAPNELEESQFKDSTLQLEAACSSERTALNHPVDPQRSELVPISQGLPKSIQAAGIRLLPTQLQLQMPCLGPPKSSFDAVAEISTSVSLLNVHKHRQDENPSDAAAKTSTSLSSLNAHEQRHYENPIDAATKMSISISCVNVHEHMQDENPVDAAAKMPASLSSLNVHEQRQDEIPIDAAAKMSTSLSSLNVHEHRRDENPIVAAAKMSTLLSLNVHEHIQDKNQVSGKSKLADYQGESLLPSGDAIGYLQKPNVNEIDKCCLSQSQGRGRGRGRHSRVRGNANHIYEQIQAQDQAQKLVTSPSNQQETIYSSQQKAPEFPVNLAHNFEQSFVVPTSESFQDCIISTVIKLPPTQLQVQTSSNVNLSKVSKMRASFIGVNVHEKQPQHCNQGIPKRKLEENTFSGATEQKPTERPRGRPPKLTVTSHPGESLPLDDGIHNVLKPSIKIMEKQFQYNQVRGRGRPRKLKCEEQFQLEDKGQHHGRGRGRGRPRILDRNANHCQEQFQQEDQAQQQHVQSRGRGRPRLLDRYANHCQELFQQEDQAQQQHVRRGRGRPRILDRNANHCQEQFEQEDHAQSSMFKKRGRGRPPILDRNANHCQEQFQQEDQTQQQHARSRGQGRPPLLDRNANHCQEQFQQEDQAQQQHVRSRGQGRPRIDQNANQCQQQFQLEDQAQQQHVRIRGRGRPHKLDQNTNKYDEHLQEEAQAQQQHFRGTGRGRPLKLNQNTNKSELHSQQEAQTLKQLVPRRGRGRPPKQKQYTN